uniref:Uncharacterized protein LOC105109948 n=1 Tax=Rhizophora mucronata TaxID=61149 RepID=A0A2P2QN21_RHIMU
MFVARNFRRHSSRTLFSLLFQSSLQRDVGLLNKFAPKLTCINGIQQPGASFKDGFSSISLLNQPFNGWCRSMSTSKGRSMRSKVERRMRKESGKTLREIRRAKKLKKKLMTDEERLIYNLKRAKKKVALLLQKLKKYELPELPPAVHDPELLTPEQLQAYKKIGFRNKNYVPVGVRGVFGGVVQNMHLHWKFHETVQVCCDNFPKEKIKEMASMLARLSGGIVVNVHDVKTIIMFRGRNYRQPKNLIPINTLTKRKALFKARFEQALESQKLNIKKIEQQLRRSGINPEDPVAMASIQRVASTFFNAIDKKEGSPYVFHWDKQGLAEPGGNLEKSEPSADSDQEELDRFIAEIEDAADKEWAEEEMVEKEEIGKIRYWNREDFGGRRRSEMHRDADMDGEVRGPRHWNSAREKQRSAYRHDDNGDSEGDNDWDSNNVTEASDFESDADDPSIVHSDHGRSGQAQRKQIGIGQDHRTKGFKRNTEARFKGKVVEEDSDSENMLSDLDNAMWESDAEEETTPRTPRAKPTPGFRSSSDEEEDFHSIREHAMNGASDFVSDADEDDDKLSMSKSRKHKENSIKPFGRNAGANSRSNMAHEVLESEDLGDSGIQMWKSDTEDNVRAYNGGKYSDGEDGENEGQVNRDEKQDFKKMKTQKEMDESFDSD